MRLIMKEKLHIQNTTASSSSLMNFGNQLSTPSGCANKSIGRIFIKLSKKVGMEGHWLFYLSFSQTIKD